MDLKFSVKGDHICLDEVLFPEKVVSLPSFINGLPVKELAAYAFSGSGAQEIYLPLYLERIGAYAFYGCENLKAIHASGRALDLGAGVFAGDRMISLLDIYEFPGEQSCLKEMLSEIRQTLRVRLKTIRYSGDDILGATGMKNIPVDVSWDNLMTEYGSEARLIFPEYYEESIENTPARQLVYEMHGCGQRYRYSFTNREFKFAEYDELFPYARIDADEAVTAELAIGRLRFPRELSSDARLNYEGFLRENWKIAAGILLDADEGAEIMVSNLEAETLPWLLENIVKPDDEQISFITDLARKKGDTAMVSYCMDYSHRNTKKEEREGASTGGRPRKRRFELT